MKEEFSSRLVNYIFAYGLKPSSTTGALANSRANLETLHSPDLLWQYPVNSHAVPFPDNLWMFCFPKQIELEKASTSPTVDNHVPQVHTFVLTDDLGIKNYGFCCTVKETITVSENSELSEPPCQLLVPRCIGIVSYWPFYTLFTNWLTILIHLSSKRELTVPFERFAC